ncbi:MAG: hypothetical protein ACO24Y_08470 [Hylemonella sp.]
MRSLFSLACTLLVGMLLPASFGLAQERIYRCGNEYTNNPTEEQKNSCRLITGGNVTVVPAQRPAASPPAPPQTPGARVDNNVQRQRDSDARRILQEELLRAEARREELLKEYNNGEPERLGPETRNYQKYLDRVASLKANLERVESDIAGIRREIGRLPASK